MRDVQPDIGNRGRFLKREGLREGFLRPRGKYRYAMLPWSLPRQVVGRTAERGGSLVHRALEETVQLDSSPETPGLDGPDRHRQAGYPRDQRRGRTRPRWIGPGGHLHRSGVLRPHARTVGRARAFRPQGGGQAGICKTGGHHTVEDVGICLGSALAEAVGDKRGITRYGSMLTPMDESLVLVALDLSGRPVLRLRRAGRWARASRGSTRAWSRSSSGRWSITRA